MIERGERKRTADVESGLDDAKTGGLPFLRDQLGGCPGDGPSGIRHAGGAKLDWALVRNVRTWPAMRREKAQAAPTARPKVPMRRRGADCLVVVMKRGNAGGAKGAGHRRWAWANWVKPGGARRFSGRRQPSCGDTSRMNLEVQVRICEGLGVQFPGPTRPRAA